MHRILRVVAIARLRVLGWEAERTDAVGQHMIAVCVFLTYINAVSTAGRVIRRANCFLFPASSCGFHSLFPRTEPYGSRKSVRFGRLAVFSTALTARKSLLAS
jgi:hypothetical protein